MVEVTSPCRPVTSLPRQRLPLGFKASPEESAVAWVFPGQGSQKLGMGVDLLKLHLARVRFEQAEQILGWSVLELCQNQEKLSRTLYTQPCLYIVLSILSDLISESGYQPNLVAGYSLGEYIALYVAGVFDFETGLRLIKRRAELMECAPKGTMVTLIGFRHEQLEQQIQQTANIWRVNDDLTCATIAGTAEAVESLLARIKVKRVIPLNVSGAFHTPLMAEAAAEFEQLLESTTFDCAQVPVLSSIEPVPTLEAAQLKKNLIRQMTQPIRWRAISLRLAAEGIKRVVGIGPSQGLTSQMKRICPGLVLTNVSSTSELLTFESRTRENFEAFGIAA